MAAAADPKAIARRLYEDVLNKGALDALDEIATQDFVEHDPLPGQTTGLEGLRQRITMLREGLGARYTIQDMIAEGDRLAVRWTNEGTHSADFLGIPATGKRFSITGIDIFRLSDGKLAEHWHVVDQLLLLQQLGLVPQP